MIKFDKKDLEKFIDLYMKFNYLAVENSEGKTSLLTEFLNYNYELNEKYSLDDDVLYKVLLTVDKYSLDCTSIRKQYYDTLTILGYDIIEE